MRQLKVYSKIVKNIPIILIILLGILPRIIFLNQVPPSIANDEINIILNAQSILKTGQNIPGVVTGIFGHPSGDLSGGVHSEISSYVLIPFYFLFGFNWPTVKIPFVLFSIGIVFMLYLIVKKLINYEAAIIVAILASVNPWLIFFARSGYESIISSFFYLLGLYIVLSKNRWKIFYALPFFIFGLWSYFAAKTLFLPLILISFYIVKFLKREQDLKPAICMVITAFIFLLVYAPLLSKSPAGGRFNELNNQDLRGLVQNNRTDSLNFPFQSLYENKIIEDLQIRTKAALGEFSLNYLFLNGQPESIPSLAIPNHGFLYLIDLPLIILGLIFLTSFNKRILILFLSLISITIIPNFLNLAGTTYSIRTVILFPILLTISSLGIYYLKNLFFKKTFKKLIFWIVVILYIFSFGNFCYQYFSRLPIDKNLGWFLDERILTRYINLSDNNIYIITSTPKQTFYRYIFFSNLYNQTDNIKQINQNMTNRIYKFQNVVFSDKCLPNKDQNSLFIYDTQSKCEHTSGLNIASIKDSGSRFKIIGDKTCMNFSLSKYPLIKNYSLLNVELLSKQQFCQNYITK